MTMPSIQSDLKQALRDTAGLGKPPSTPRDTPDAELPREDPRPWDANKWLPMVALLAVTGQSTEQIAQKMQVPIARLQAWMQMDIFEQFLKDAARESAVDVTDELLRGAAVDSIWTLIKLRDNDNVKAEVRAKICFYIVDRVKGIEKKGMPERAGDLSEALKRAGEGSVRATLDEQIARHIENDPVLRRKRDELLKSSQPEAGQPGSTVSGGRSVTPKSEASLSAPLAG